MADIVMKTDPSIAGDSSISGHEDWITTHGIGFSIARTVETTGAEVELGSADLSDFEIRKTNDKATPLLFAQTLKPKSEAKFNSVTIDFVESSGEVNLQIVLKDAYISDFAVSGAGAGTGSETLNFTYVEMMVKKGKEKKTYNRKTRKLS